MPLPIIETTAKRTIREMAERAMDAKTAARKNAAERKLLIMQGNWRGLAQSYVGGLYSEDAVRRAVSRRVKVTANVLMQVCKQVCVAYEREPMRRIMGASEEQEKAYARVTREAQIRVCGKEWERKTFGLGATIVVPIVRNQRFGYMHLLPHAFELIADPADPMGDPLAVVVELADSSDRTDRPLKYALLDHEAWWFYDERSQPIGQPLYHNAGIFPGTTFRLSKPEDDWFDQFRSDGLVDATLEVAHLRARMDWVRFHQDRFKETLATEHLKKMPSQVAGAEGPVELGVHPAEVKLDALDVNTSIENARAHIRDHIEAACESYGIPVSAVDVSHLVESVTPLGHLISHQAAEKIRSDHAAHLDHAERDLAWKSALMLRGMGHPDAGNLPPDLVRQGFEIEFIASPYLQDPKTQLEVDKAEVDQGLASTYRVYMRRHPGVTFEEAKAEVDKIAEEEATLDKVYIQHGLPRDSGLRGASREQLLGTIGGQRSGQVRSEPQDDQTP